MNKPVATNPKIHKLICMLATESDGEIISTVRALNRTLKTAKLDFNDLADGLVTAPKRVPVCRVKPMTMTIELLRLQRLSKWEGKFVRSIRRRVDNFQRLSPKQESMLTEIYSREFSNEGTRR